MKDKMDWTSGKAPMSLTSNFDAFVSPVDGTLITGQQSLKEHNSRNDVVQVGNDYVNLDAKTKTNKKGD